MLRNLNTCTHLNSNLTLDKKIPYANSWRKGRVGEEAKASEFWMEILTIHRTDSRKVCHFCYFSAFPRKDGLLPYACLLAAEHQRWPCRRHWASPIHTPLPHLRRQVSSDCLHILLRFRKSCHLHQDDSPSPTRNRLARARSTFL